MDYNDFIPHKIQRTKENINLIKDNLNKVNPSLWKKLIEFHHLED